MSTVRGGLVYPVDVAPHAERLTPTGVAQLVDWASGRVQVLDLGTASGDVAITFANALDGAVYHLVMARGDDDHAIASWPANVRWPGGVPPILEDAAGSRIYHVVELVYQEVDDVYVARDLSAAETFIAKNAVGEAQIEADAVSDGKLRDSAGASVIGRALGTTGDPADIVAAVDRQYLGRRAGTLAFRGLELADLPPLAVSGQVDFGSGVESDYATVALAVNWPATTVVMAAVRGGTADHPLADEDALLEQLTAVVVAQSGTSVTVGVHAPNGTWGKYVVTIIAGGVA